MDVESIKLTYNYTTNGSKVFIDNHEGFCFYFTADSLINPQPYHPFWTNNTYKKYNLEPKADASLPQPHPVNTCKENRPISKALSRDKLIIDFSNTVLILNAKAFGSINFNYLRLGLRGCLDSA